MNEKQLEAFNTVTQGRNLFLTGSAGTGKSYTLKSIVQYLDMNNIEYGLTALTGCAAVLINGQTIHSFLYLGISRNVDEIYENINKYKGSLIKFKKLRVLIIDEISMMDNDLFDIIHRLLIRIKGIDKPFGGVQMILVGDFHQLPPINHNYCFTSDLWNQLNLIPVVLTQIIRQKDDNKLQLLLEDIRNGDKLTDETIETLKSLVISKPSSNDVKPTRLYPINTNVDKINKYEFQKLLKINNNVKVTYKPIINMKDTKIDLSQYEITLTLNAQVMVIRNISIDNKLFNGTRGVVVELKDKSVVIKDTYDNYHEISYYIDINKNIKNQHKNLQISFIPLKLAYAISIHKSQGASIDNLEIDIGEDVFTTGQLYTALSRATNIDNLKLINFSSSSFILNENVKKFYNNLKKNICN
jgi:ATP-dependent DNA helicase PIF1